MSRLGFKRLLDLGEEQQKAFQPRLDRIYLLTQLAQIRTKQMSGPAYQVDNEEIEVWAEYLGVD